MDRLKPNHRGTDQGTVWWTFLQTGKWNERTKRSPQLLQQSTRCVLMRVSCVAAGARGCKVTNCCVCAVSCYLQLHSQVVCPDRLRTNAYIIHLLVGAPSRSYGNQCQHSDQTATAAFPSGFSERSSVYCTWLHHSIFLLCWPELKCSASINR